MLFRKKFENLHTVMAILVLFEQFSDIFCLYFWPLILSTSPNLMHFVRTVSIICVLKATQAYCYKEIQNYGKILYSTSKALLKMAGGGMHPPPPSRSAPGYASYYRKTGNLPIKGPILCCF